MRKQIQKQIQWTVRRTFHQSGFNLCGYSPNHPFIKTLRILANDFAELKRLALNRPIDDKQYQRFVPLETDILVVGGGPVGVSIAYELMKRANSKMRVVVLEKDPSLRRTSALLSLGELHQQFTSPESIEMALYGADYFRDIKEMVSNDDCVHFEPYGFLQLADESNADQLINDFSVQEELGVRNQLFSQAALKKCFPWLNVDGVEVANYGVEKQGWFDHWSYFFGLKRAAIKRRVDFIDGELVDFEFQTQTTLSSDAGEIYFYPRSAKIKLNNGEQHEMRFAFIVLAAGCQTKQVAMKAKIGCVKQDLLKVELPIEPRNRYVFSIECENGPLLDMPMILDTTKLCMRRFSLSKNYVVSYSPEIGEEFPEDKQSYFFEKLHPIIKNRIPSLTNVKVVQSAVGSYGYNTYDGNGILGPHPYFFNLYFATGFSNAGIQMAPAIGRAVNEMLIDGELVTTDISNFHFKRIVQGTKIEEHLF